jgi:hypothetical protein
MFRREQPNWLPTDAPNIVISSTTWVLGCRTSSQTRFIRETVHAWWTRKSPACRLRYHRRTRLGRSRITEGCFAEGADDKNVTAARQGLKCAWPPSNLLEMGFR